MVLIQFFKKGVLYDVCCQDGWANYNVALLRNFGIKSIEIFPLNTEVEDETKDDGQDLCVVQKGTGRAQPEKTALARPVQATGFSYRRVLPELPVKRT